MHVLVFYRLMNWKMHGETLKITLVVRNILNSRAKYSFIYNKQPTTCTQFVIYTFIIMWQLPPHTLPVIYRVSQEECEILRESVPYVKLYRNNPKHLYPKLNGYGDNGQRKVWTSCISAIYTPTAVSRATPSSGRITACGRAGWLVVWRSSPAQRDKTVLQCC